MQKINTLINIYSQIIKKKKIAKPKTDNPAHQSLMHSAKMQKMGLTRKEKSEAAGCAVCMP